MTNAGKRSLSPRASSHIPSYVQQELRPLLFIPCRGLSLSITWHLCRWCNLYLIWSSESPRMILSSVETWDVPMERKPVSHTPNWLPLTFLVVTGPCILLYGRGLLFHLRRLPSKSVGNCRLSACCLSSFVEPLLIDEIGNKPTDDRSLMFWWSCRPPSNGHWPKCSTLYWWEG